MKDIGIAVYRILQDGCLNGTWSHNNNNGEIFNEIAKRKNPNDNCLCGIYKYSFIETDLVVHEGELEIIENRNSYDFTWREGNDVKFKGIGLRTDNIVSVSYWAV